MAAAAASRLATAFVAIRPDTNPLVKGMQAVQKIVVSSLQKVSSLASTVLIEPFKRLFGIIRRLGSTIISSMLAPLKLVTSQMGLLVGGLTAGALIGGATTAFADFEKSMSRVRALVQPTARQFADLENLARDLGKTTAFSAAEAAEAMGNFSQAGFSVNEIMNAMKPTLDLAASGALGIGEASDIAAKIMRGMQIPATEMTRVADVMTNAFISANTDLTQLGEAFKFVGPNAVQAGVSLEQVTSALQLLADAGIQGGMAGTSLRNIFLRLQAQPKEVAEALEKLGVSVEDGNGEFRDFGDILGDLERELGKLPGVQRQATIAAIAGTRSFAALNVLLSNGADKFNEYTRAVSDSGTANRVAEERLNNLFGSLVRLRSAAGEVAIQFGERFGPALRELVDQVTGLMPALGQLAAMFGGAMAASTARLTSLIDSLHSFIGRNMQSFTDWGRSLSEIRDGITEAASLILQQFIPSFRTVDGAVNAVTVSLDNLSVLLSDIPRTLRTLRDAFLDAGFGGRIKDRIDDIGKSLLGMMRALGSAMMTIGRVIASSLELPLTVIRAVLKTLFNEVELFVQSVINQFKLLGRLDPTGLIAATVEGIEIDLKQAGVEFRDALSNAGIALSEFRRIFQGGALERFKEAFKELKNIRDIERFGDALLDEAKKFGMALSDAFDQASGRLGPLGKKMRDLAEKAFGGLFKRFFGDDVDAAERGGGGTISDIQSFLQNLQKSLFDDDVDKQNLEVNKKQLGVQQNIEVALRNPRPGVFAAGRIV